MIEQLLPCVSAGLFYRRAGGLSRAALGLQRPRGGAAGGVSGRVRPRAGCRRRLPRVAGGRTRPPPKADRAATSALRRRWRTHAAAASCLGSAGVPPRADALAVRAALEAAWGEAAALLRQQGAPPLLPSPSSLPSPHLPSARRGCWRNASPVTRVAPSRSFPAEPLLTIDRGPPPEESSRCACELPALPVAHRRGRPTRRCSARSRRGTAHARCGALSLLCVEPTHVRYCGGGCLTVSSSICSFWPGPPTGGWVCVAGAAGIAGGGGAGGGGCVRHSPAMTET